MLDNWLYKKQKPILGLSGFGGGAHSLALFVSAAVASYQISKSLRFNPADDARLKRTPSSSGNRRIFTFAAWVKKSNTCHEIFAAPGSGNAYFVIGFDSSDRMHVAVGDGSDNNVTNRVFRDAGAWFHVVVAVDTTKSTQSERLKIHINGGAQESSFNASPDFVSNVEFGVNQSSVIQYVGGDSGSSSDHDGYLADVYLIDGLQLHPAAFGQFSDSENWNPKTFALPTPNQGTTYSSSASNTGNVWSAHTNNETFQPDAVFDGTLTRGTGPYAASGGSGTQGTCTFPVGTQTGKHYFRHYGRLYADGKWEDQDGNLIYRSTADDDTNKWYDLGWHSDVTSLKITAGSHGNTSDVYALEVDGVILRDGFTDPETRSNPNNGTTWSSNLASSTGSFYGSMPATKAFNGNLSDAADASSTGGTMTFTPSSAITFNTLEMYAGGAQGGDQTITLTDSSDNTTQVVTTVTDWVTVKSGGGTLKSLALAASSGVYASWYALRIDGHVLIDDAVDNSVHLKFDDSTDLGNDSLSSNDYAPVGITTALDLVNDSPTNFTDGDGVHGNFCTLDPSSSAPDFEFSEGNLVVKSSGSGSDSNHYGHVFGTMGIPSSSGGKFYFEVELTDSDRLSYGFGIQKRHYSSNTNTPLAINQGDSTWANNTYNFSGRSGSWRNSYEGGGSVNSSYGPNVVFGTVLGFAVDFSNDTTSGGEVFLTVDGVDQGNINSSAIKEGLYTPVLMRGSDADGMGMKVNFGQHAFSHLPSGFTGWCTQSLDNFDSDNNPSKYFDVLTYSGTGSTLTVKGLAFQPDIVWGKQRNATNNYVLQDQVGTGTTVYLRPDTTEAAGTAGGVPVSAFNSDGVTLGTNNRLNDSSGTHVMWAWDAGTSAATASDDGSITPSAQWVNTTSGCSISKYIGSGSNATVGHGLGAAPDFYIVKAVDATGNWNVASPALGIGYALVLNSDADKGSSGTSYWNNTDPTSTVVSIGTADSVNKSGDTFLMICWTEISGYSKFGTYVGNGNANGPSIHTGFRPKWIMIKHTSAQAGWAINDAGREKINVSETSLLADSGAGEFTSNSFNVDFLSNSFKLRTSNANWNANGVTYVYATFAEQPFKTARAR